MIPEKIREMINCYDKELVDLAVSVIKEMEAPENWIDALKDCTYYRTNLIAKTGEVIIEEVPQYGFSGYSAGVSGTSGASGWTGTYTTTGTINPIYTTSTGLTTTVYPYPISNHVTSRERADYLKEIYNYYYKNKNHQNEESEFTAIADSAVKEENEAGLGGHGSEGQVLEGRI